MAAWREVGAFGKRDMKSVRMMLLLVWLACMGSGCASLSPSAANAPTWRQEMGEKEPDSGTTQTNPEPLYSGLAYSLGELLEFAINH